MHLGAQAGHIQEVCHLPQDVPTTDKLELGIHQQPTAYAQARQCYRQGKSWDLNGPRGMLLVTLFKDYLWLLGHLAEVLLRVLEVPPLHLVRAAPRVDLQAQERCRERSRLIQRVLHHQCQCTHMKALFLQDMGMARYRDVLCQVFVGQRGPKQLLL